MYVVNVSPDRSLILALEAIQRLNTDAIALATVRQYRLRRYPPPRTGLATNDSNELRNLPRQEPIAEDGLPSYGYYMTGRRIQDPARPAPALLVENYDSAALQGRLAFADRLHHLLPLTKAKKCNRRHSSQRAIESGGQRTIREHVEEATGSSLPPPYMAGIGEVEQAGVETPTRYAGQGEAHEATANGVDESLSPPVRAYLGDEPVR
ncbi:hypothetical protein BKA70DRAFT_1471280 [Coprinopsis sp. MPI-PUGE-AT-0042]|nr:hypothetical protein BKA70DRAFT_1471280 [Coprinopsis sp. MPI-PUGE-AT-0042]